MSRLIHLVRSQGLGLLALLLVLTGGTAYAASAAKDSVVSKSIKNGQVKTVDLMDGAVTKEKVADGSLTGGDVADGSLLGNDLQDNTVTGADVNESTLGVVNNAATISGVSATQLMRSAVYKKLGPVGDGTLLPDGTRTQALACDAGDILLHGGPADIAPPTTLLESLPSGGDLTITNSWTVRINTFGGVDPFRVVIVCVDQS